MNKIADECNAQICPQRKEMIKPKHVWREHLDAQNASKTIQKHREPRWLPIPLCRYHRAPLEKKANFR